MAGLDQSPIEVAADPFRSVLAAAVTRSWGAAIV